jgi:DNA-binding XRE family transcriptional regulator
MIYNRIKTLRVEKGLSRKELADAVGVNFQTIGYLERGDYNASLELAFKLAEYFGVPIDVAFSPRPFKSLSEQLTNASRAAE